MFRILCAEPCSFCSMHGGTVSTAALVNKIQLVTCCAQAAPSYGITCTDVTVGSSRMQPGSSSYLRFALVLARPNNGRNSRMTPPAGRDNAPREALHSQRRDMIEKAGNYGEFDHFLVRKKLCLRFAWCTVSILHYAGSSTLSGGRCLHNLTHRCACCHAELRASQAVQNVRWMTM